jgi:hypothetical protein
MGIGMEESPVFIDFNEVFPEIFPSSFSGPDLPLEESPRRVISFAR